jgi:arylsulfatase
MRSSHALLALAALASGCGREGPEDGRVSVVLVVIDTTRADHLGPYGAERDTTPFLNAWSRRGMVFERALATSSWTLPSMGSLLTGLYPNQHGAGRPPTSKGGSFAGLAQAAPTLTEALHDAGYRTGAFVNNPFLHPTFGLDRAFDHYEYVEGHNAPDQAAGPVVDSVQRWLAEEDARWPFFLLVHLMDPHLAYDPDPSVRGTFTAGLETSLELPIERRQTVEQAMDSLTQSDWDLVTGAYDEELRYVDDQLARLFTLLDERPGGDSTLVVVTSDHGEEFAEHGGFEHGHTLFQELLHVPLLIVGPGVRAARVDTPVSLVDVAPTILAAAGLGHGGQAGASLWPLLDGSGELPERALLAEGNLYGGQRRAIVRWPHKLVLDLRSGSASLYDLAADPLERTDLAAEQPERARQLEQELPALPRAEPSTTTVDVGADLQQDLQELGYVE